MPLLTAVTWLALVFGAMLRQHIWLPLLTSPAALLASALAYGGEASRRTSQKKSTNQALA